MGFEAIKKAFKKSKPYVEKVAIDTTKGYLFGCVFGAFSTSNAPVTKKMHSNGMNFAKMSAVYSITDLALKKYRQKDDSCNSIVAGALAGAVGAKNNRVFGSTLFSFYSGASYMLSNNEYEL